MPLQATIIAGSADILTRLLRRPVDRYRDSDPRGIKRSMSWLWWPQPALLNKTARSLGQEGK